MQTTRPLRDPQVSGRPSNIPLGAGYMIGAALCFALAPAMARSAASEMNVLALVFWSNLWMFAIVCAWTFIGKQRANMRTKKLATHFLRAVLTYSAIVAYFIAVTRIPFANAVILQSMGPLFVPLLAFLLFRRIADRFVWLGVLVSFAGVGLIVRPEGLAISYGEIAALLAALGGAAATLVISALSTTEPAARQMFYFAVFAFVLSTLTLPWVWQMPTSNEIIQIGLVAAFTLGGQFLYSKALAAAPAEKVNTWIYMSLVFAALIGFFAWGEPIHALTLGGAALVVVGAYLATRHVKRSAA